MKLSAAEFGDTSEENKKREREITVTAAAPVPLGSLSHSAEVSASDCTLCTSQQQLAASLIAASASPQLTSRRVD